MIKNTRAETELGMKQLVEQRDAEEVSAEFPLGGLLPGWYFRVHEVSAGQYIAEGMDLWGHKVSHQGDNSYVVLTQSVSSARMLVADVDREGDAT